MHLICLLQTAPPPRPDPIGPTGRWGRNTKHGARRRWAGTRISKPMLYSFLEEFND
jgi:hypothetical protein